MSVIHVPKSRDGVFDDWYQVMYERGAACEVIAEAGMTRNEASADKEYNYEMNNVDPLELTDEAKRRIIESRGGTDALVDFMAGNAGWDDYVRAVGESDGTDDTYDYPGDGR